MHMEGAVPEAANEPTYNTERETKIYYLDTLLILSLFSVQVLLARPPSIPPLISCGSTAFFPTRKVFPEPVFLTCVNDFF